VWDNRGVNTSDPRSHRLLAAAAALLMALLGFAAAMWWRQSGQAAPVTLATGTMIEPRRELPDFSLLDLHGAAFTRESLRGHWSLLFFGYTNCPDVCPTTLSTLATLARNLEQAHPKAIPQVVFVSVDARRDTPAVLARYVPYFHAGFNGITAPTQAGIEDFARRMGVAVMIGEEHEGTYSVDHSAAIFVIAPDARLAAILTGPHTVAALGADWSRILESAP
jgi:protein SCO1/2